MACTYDYQTGRVTLDFHLVEHGEICPLRGFARAIVGKPGCKSCRHNGGSISDMSVPADWVSFVKCKHPDSVDSKSCRFVKSILYEKIQIEALSCL